MSIGLISILANKAHGKRKYIWRISWLVQSSSDHVNPSLILARLVKGAHLTLIIYHRTHVFLCNSRRAKLLHATTYIMQPEVWTSGVLLSRGWRESCEQPCAAILKFDILWGSARSNRLFSPTSQRDTFNVLLNVNYIISFIL